MGVRIGVLVLLVVGISLVYYVESRALLAEDLLDTQGAATKTKTDGVCALCEDYVSLAINYLSTNETQTEIIHTLHLGCSQTHSFKEECFKMVDYYAPLFFLEIGKVEPGELCSKLSLCDIPVFATQDSCTLCHQAVAEVLAKLDDPDTQLEIIEILLKVCNKTEQYAKKCKRLVFEYGPLIMANAEKFLVKNDVCTTIHACKTSTDGSGVALSH
ncbi:hypothetical protein IFM89_036841 [Coptis chinensis]|uniref:Pulmonary surfactant-associated protein B n=1 Tax=Coptis chinensis TaxID=261450 RepID=A0A835H2T2_9MAGN|nr:hypothetical protein IFM89_036841 [Coptis chinensis]